MNDYTIQFFVIIWRFSLLKIYLAKPIFTKIKNDIILRGTFNLK